jgi:hypothetical protein
MKRLIVTLALALLASPVYADPPPWAHDVKKTVTKDFDFEEVVVEVDGVKAGYRYDHGRRYDLLWERDPKALGLRHRLHAHEVTKVFPAERDPIVAPDALPAVADPLAVADLTPVVIDVNYFYTAQVAAAQGGEANMAAFAALTCELSNQTYANSGLGHITWRCLGPFKAAYADTTNLDDALAWMSAGGGGAADIAAKYVLTGADLSHLVINSGGGSCGLGYINSGTGTALSTSDRTCVNSNLSGPHEMGHNMGFHHDPATVGCTTISPTSGVPYCNGSYNYGHSWPIGAPKWRSIMAYPGAGGTRITQISNPNVINNGFPTGIPNERDNARVAVARAPIVSQFRFSPGTFPVPRPPGQTGVLTGRTYVTIALSPDDLATFNGTLVITNYTVAFRRVSDGVVTDTVNCGKPQNGNCTIPLTVPGTVLYTATAAAIGPGGSSAGPPSGPFTKQLVTPAPAAPGKPTVH